jgi:hypothetical protein
MEQEFAELKKQVQALQKELARVSGKGISSWPPSWLSNKPYADEAEVRKTHHKYGYYLDKCLYNEVSSDG